MLLVLYADSPVMPAEHYDVGITYQSPNHHHIDNFTTVVNRSTRRPRTLILEHFREVTGRHQHGLSIRSKVCLCGKVSGSK